MWISILHYKKAPKLIKISRKQTKWEKNIFIFDQSCGGTNIKIGYKLAKIFMQEFFMKKKTTPTFEKIWHKCQKFKLTCSNEFLSVFNAYTLNNSGIFFNLPSPPLYKTQHQKIAWGLICRFLKSLETDKLTKKFFKWVEKIMYIHVDHS